MLPTYDEKARPARGTGSRLRTFFKSIFASADSRNLFLFLLVNLSFAFVELLYGIWTNSLGLISDSFHMFFDCSALLLGLIASIVARKKANDLYSYGYLRAEVLGGFVNALFLVFVAFFIFKEALERFFEPPHVHTHRLLLVAVLGLAVNLLGIFAFQHGGHGHSHNGGGHDHGKSEAKESHHGHSHGHGHEHAHGAGAAECKEEEQPARRNYIMDGVLLHIISDTLGSVGVIISSLLIHQYGWMVADPVCSLFIATLTFISTMPLLRSSIHILMQRTPVMLEDNLQACFQKVHRVPDVIDFSEPHFWTLTGAHYMGSIKAGVTNMVVQIDRAADGLSSPYYGRGIREM